MTGETRVLGALGRLFAKPPPSDAGHRDAHLTGLRQLLGWLAPAAAAFAALAVASGAAFRDRSTVVGALAMGGAVAMVFLLLRRVATQVLESLDDASVGQARLEAQLAAVLEAKEEYRTFAYHDDLTGLLTGALPDRLGLAITHSSLQGHLALLYLDIDDARA
jgi:hypothetical protein